jgi:hypothetical protein
MRTPRPILRRFCRGVVSTSIAAVLAACSAYATGAVVELKGQRFEVELAADDASRARGLMFRDQLPANHGMLFVFERPAIQTFWMKNTHLPLDILYFDPEYKLINVQQRVPPCRSAGDDCPLYPSTAPAQYVLELNAGTADALGVKPGDVLRVIR